MQAFNQQVIAEYRTNAGKLSGQMANAELLLLNTVGARSGMPRTAPLGFAREADHFVVVAAGAHGESHPAWYYNLLAAPTARVELGGESFHVRGRVTAGQERERLYQLMASRWPIVRERQQQKSQPIPVLVLERIA
jgi:deazaflavin-dependent oxidoreductase (nitroreductase family)